MERDVRFPNQVFITMRSMRNVDLDVAVQLTLQPERMEDDKVLMQQLQKTRQRIDVEIAERIEQELLTFYMQNETAVGKQNFVKENVRTAENTPTTDMKQRIYQHNNQVHMLRSIDAKNKKNEIIMNQPMHIMDKMTRTQDKKTSHWSSKGASIERAGKRWRKVEQRMREIGRRERLYGTQETTIKTKKERAVREIKEWARTQYLRRTAEDGTRTHE